MPNRRLLPALAIALACGSFSCVAILGFERLHEDGGFVLEGGADATDEADVAVAADAGPDSSACGVVGVPDPPTTDGPDGPVVLFALKTLDFGVGVDGGIPAIPGYNLDQTCSFDIATSSCTTNVLESTFDQAAKDRTPTGLDNAGFSLISYISGFSPILTASTLNQGIAAGHYGAVFRLTHWNGQPDDDDVLLEVFPAIAFETTDGGVPTFTPSDQWVLDQRFQRASLVDSSQITTQLTGAYVTGGQLVARFEPLIMPILIQTDPKPFDLQVHNALVTGSLVTTDAGTSLSAATMTGRWKTSDFLNQVRLIYIRDAIGLQDVVLCEPGGQGLYNQVKGEVCLARDIRSDGHDNAQLPCDAMSAALRVETYPLDTRGDFDAGPDIPARCTSDADIPDGDDCVP